MPPPCDLHFVSVGARRAVPLLLRQRQCQILLAGRAQPTTWFILCSVSLSQECRLTQITRITPNLSRELFLLDIENGIYRLPAYSDGHSQPYDCFGKYGKLPTPKTPTSTSVFYLDSNFNDVYNQHKEG